MHPFSYHKASTLDDAVKQAARTNAKFIGGGTNLIDLMKENIEKPEHLIDVNSLSLREVKRLEDGALHLGALVSNAQAAYHDLTKESHPLLSDAILAGASAQLRNMATCGGNPLQRTRCYYFYDKATKCNKREPGSGCDAIPGYNRIHAVLGQSDACIATHPSDMCVALAALDASVEVRGPQGERSIPMREFHKLPGETPWIETELKPGEMITALRLPKTGFTRNYAYLKVRDRSSYAFALVSAAVALELGPGVIKRAQLAIGGVAHKPWRDFEAEKILVGASPTRDTFKKFAATVFENAKGYRDNSFKIQLGQKVLVRALEEACEKKGHA